MKTTILLAILTVASGDNGDTDNESAVEDVQIPPSTLHYEICQAFVKNFANPCNVKCMKKIVRTAPSFWPADAYIDAEITSKYRKDKDFARKYIDKVMKSSGRCAALAYCGAYLHLCHGCGKSSIWHKSEFVDADGKIQFHPSYSGAVSRTVNGIEPVPHSAPWNVFVQFDGTQELTGLKFGCGGTLIDANTVITAAHCIEDDIPRYDLFFGSHEPANGTRYGSNVTNIGLQHRTVSWYNAWKHKDAEAPVMEFVIRNDIAILKFDVPVQYSHKVSPACLPDGLPVDYYQKGNKSHRFLAGSWGNSKAGDGWWSAGERYREIVVEEMKVTTPVGSPEMWIEVRHPLNVNEDNEFRSVCQGDSGTGLLTKLEDNWTVAGIVSFGIPCTSVYGYARNDTTVYTNVVNYVPWLRARMGALNDTYDPYAPDVDEEE